MGLVLYLLIGFYFMCESVIYVNMKVFFVNCVGDFGFLFGIGLLFVFVGLMNYGEVFVKCVEFVSLYFLGIDWGLLIVVCICLFIGVMGKLV